MYYERKLQGHLHANICRLSLPYGQYSNQDKISTFQFFGTKLNLRILLDKDFIPYY